MQFLNPYYLIGLSAVAVPIIIHLFHFRKYKKVYFSNVSMLKSIQLQQQKNERLKHWIVLLLRIFALVFLVLAASRPFFPAKNSPVAAEGINKVTVYVDNSFSMENESTNNILFEQAKQKALDIASAFSPSDRFMLVTNDFEGKHQHFVSQEQFSSLIHSLTISSAPKKMSEILSLSHNFLQPEAGNPFTFFISDFQESFMDFDHVDAAENGVDFLCPLPVSTTENVYIDTIVFSAPIFQLGYDVSLTVKVTNYRAENIEKLPVKLFVNGKQRAISGIDIPEEGSEKVTMTFKIEETGYLNGYVEIADSPITFDDKFFFTLHVGEQIKAMCINGGSGANPFLNRLFKSDSLVACEDVSESNIPYSRISSFHFLVLNELSALTETLMKALEELLEYGGNVLIIPSNEAHLSGYNDMLTRRNLPFFENSTDQPLPVSHINTQHPLYAGVFQKLPKNMELPTLKKGFQLKTPARSTKESILKLASGNDFLTQNSVRNGKIYLLACPLNEESTNFMQQALFVPTIYNMALNSQSIASPFYYFGNPEPILLHTAEPNKEIEQQVKITLPETGFTIIPEQYRQAQTLKLKLNEQIKQAGHYHVLSENKDIASFSLNYDRNESHLKFLSNSEIADKIKANPLLKNMHLLNGMNTPVKTQIQNLTQGTHITKYLIFASLLCLLAEVLLLVLSRENTISFFRRNIFNRLKIKGKSE